MKEVSVWWMAKKGEVETPQYPLHVSWLRLRLLVLIVKGLSGSIIAVVHMLLSMQVSS